MWCRVIWIISFTILKKQVLWNNVEVGNLNNFCLLFLISCVPSQLTVLLYYKLFPTFKRWAYWFIWRLAEEIVICSKIVEIGSVSSAYQETRVQSPNLFLLHEFSRVIFQITDLYYLSWLWKPSLLSFLLTPLSFALFFHPNWRPDNQILDRFILQLV